MPARLSKIILSLALVICLTNLARAQGALPTDFDMRIDMQLARQRMADALKGTKLPEDMNGSSVPRIEILPKPVAKNPDLSQIAEGYRQFPATNVARPADLPELMVFGVHPIQGDTGSSSCSGETQSGNPDRHRRLRRSNELCQGRRGRYAGLRPRSN